MTENTLENNVIRDLGDGLVLRRGTRADAEALANFYGRIFAREPEEPSEFVRGWVGDLTTTEHPTFRVNDFTVVEDSETHAIVSALCLIPQTWTYAGIPFGVGRVELVATDPERRQRGLIRAQFEVVHRWSLERGHKMQAITGIPYFYRQFGYEMAMDLGGGRACYPPQVPKLKEGEEEPCRLRPATGEDVPFLAQVYARGTQRKLIACPYDEEMWRYDLEARGARSGARREMRIIETAQGEPLGYLAHAPWLRGGALAIAGYELKEGASWLAVTPAVIRYLASTAQAYGEQDPRETYQYLQFWLGAEHPLYEVFQRNLPHTYPPYAWYIRIADMADFIRHIAPVLERRLQNSLAPGHSGEIKLSFYRSGLRLVLDEGRLTAVEPWNPINERASAAFPDRTFIKLVVGHQTADELRESFPDCLVSSDEARLLLDTMFPKQSSHLWIIG